MKTPEEISAIGRAWAALPLSEKSALFFGIAPSVDARLDVLREELHLQHLRTEQAETELAMLRSPKVPSVLSDDEINEYARLWWEINPLWVGYQPWGGLDSVRRENVRKAVRDLLFQGLGPYSTAYERVVYAAFLANALQMH